MSNAAFKPTHGNTYISNMALIQKLTHEAYGYVLLARVSLVKCADTIQFGHLESLYNASTAELHLGEQWRGTYNAIIGELNTLRRLAGEGGRLEECAPTVAPSRAVMDILQTEFPIKKQTPQNKRKTIRFIFSEFDDAHTSIGKAIKRLSRLEGYEMHVLLFKNTISTLQSLKLALEMSEA